MIQQLVKIGCNEQDMVREGNSKREEKITLLYKKSLGKFKHVTGYFLIINSLK